MIIEPDIAGFRDGMRRLRQDFGLDIVFLVPNAPVWDADEPIDPETGEPYDPYATPDSGGENVEVTVRCTVVSRPLNRLLGDERYDSAIGRVGGDSLGLIVDICDYPKVQGATHATVQTVRYKVTDFRHDVTAHVERMVAFLEKG